MCKLRDAQYDACDDEAKNRWFPPYVPPTAVATETACEVPRVIKHRLAGYLPLVPETIFDATGIVWFEWRAREDVAKLGDEEAAEPSSQTSEADETMQLTAAEVTEERDREEDERLEEAGAEEEEEEPEENEEEEAD